MSKPIIISTDPGIDDAVSVSICLNSTNIDVKLLVATAGNVGVDKTALNLLKLEKFMGKDVPVVRGSEKALLKESIEAIHVHGESGMDGYDFPKPDINQLINKTAPEAIHEAIMNSNQKVTLLGTAPLTDYALFIRLYPQDLERIDELIIMGTTMGRGNHGIYSEFNIAGDPEAAQIVFRSGLKIKVAPLDLGQKARIMPEQSEKIKTLGKVGDMFYSLFKRFRGGSFESGLKIYDALATGILLNPSMFKFQDAYVEIDTRQGPTYGASLIDFRGFLQHMNNATIATDVDVKQFREWFIDSIATVENHVDND